VARRPAVRWFSIFVGLGVAAVCAYASRGVWLPHLADPLIYSDRPVQADIAVTLAGDLRGQRLAAAAKLVETGYVPRVIVSGPAMFGAHESEFAIEQVVREGYARAWFVGVPHESNSTWEEAHVLLEDLKHRNIRRFLLVTSNYHTARARRLFLRAEREMGGGPEMLVIAAPCDVFDRDSWWRHREGRKIFLDEWLKTIAAFLRM
jgi:uncharacterized SAM-binding protein YcdF (DUF218 family)